MRNCVRIGEHILNQNAIYRIYTIATGSCDLSICQHIKGIIPLAFNIRIQAVHFEFGHFFIADQCICRNHIYVWNRIHPNYYCGHNAIVTETTVFFQDPWRKNKCYTLRHIRSIAQVKLPVGIICEWLTPPRKYPGNTWIYNSLHVTLPISPDGNIWIS